MPTTVDYTIAYTVDTTTVDLCKIIFGSDGSYYVTAPYHPNNRALAAKITVNYATQQDGRTLLSLQSEKELATLDDGEHRLKLSHHPDGFVQFSGQGIVSGLDSDGRPKGMGTFTWPLNKPVLGPSFQLGFSSPVRCGRPSRARPQTITFSESEIAHMRVIEQIRDGLQIIGYYFPPWWREFVHSADGEAFTLDLVHPNSQSVKKLRAVLASPGSGFPGGIGLEARPYGLEEPGGVPSFVLNSSTGNLRRNRNGELLGDQLLCAYPRPDFDTASLPSLNVALDQLEYQVPPLSKWKKVLWPVIPPQLRKRFRTIWR